VILPVCFCVRLCCLHDENKIYIWHVGLFYILEMRLSPLIMSLGRLINDLVGLSLQILFLLLEFLVEVVKTLSLYAKGVDLFA